MAGVSPNDPGVRVAVVDDSAVVRGLVSRWVESEPDMNMVGRYSNGQLAVDGIPRTTPDVAVLDIEMPVMDGMTALPLMLKANPGLKVIMASTLTRRNAEISLKALSLGAVDYIPKPETNSGVTTSAEFRKELIRKIKAVGAGRARRRVASETGSAARPAPNARTAAAKPAPAAPTAGTPSLRPVSNVTPRILAVASSTGGPQALNTFFTAIAPMVSKVPVLLTQHMPTTFTAILAEHLGRAAGAKAKEGEHGEPIAAGTIYVAPGGNHMRLVKKGDTPEIEIYDGPSVNFCKPAADPMLESVAKFYGNASLGVILTGMGHDGAAGATLIADRGGTIVAQDEATSVVWGMPGAAAAAGACAAILPLKDIGPKVAQLLRGGRA